jgi:uncharacterized membrane protein YtjA (UPF0391 family)
MLRLALLCLVIALLAGLFGFPIIEGLTFEAAKIFFFIFIVLAVIFMLGGLFRGSRNDVV